MTKLPDYLKECDGYTEITLSKPLEVMGSKVNVITMREPTVADQETTASMDGSNATREVHEFANLCGMAPDDLRKMGMRDYKRLHTAYLAFLV